MNRIRAAQEGQQQQDDIKNIEHPQKTTDGKQQHPGKIIAAEGRHRDSQIQPRHPERRDPAVSGRPHHEHPGQN